MLNTDNAGSLFGTGNTFSDPWIANSLLQKAIRRGDVPLAQRAALSFHALRGSAIWRRFMIIAFEDVGLGGIDTVVATVSACVDPAYRKAIGGNARAVFELSAQLAVAAKDRSADYLIGASAEHPQLELTRRSLAAGDLSSRLKLAGDDRQPLSVRATAAWYASGVQSHLEQRMSGGDLSELSRTYCEFGVPAELVNASSQAARRTREPLTVLLPLLWLAVRGQPSTRVDEIALPSVAYVETIPLYAFDKHTRVGRQAIDLLARENTCVRGILERYAGVRSGLEAVRLAAFHAESACVKRRLIWPLAESIERFGTTSDLLYAGVAPEGHALLIAAVRDNLEHLNELRVQIFTHSRSQNALLPPIRTEI